MHIDIQSRGFSLTQGLRDRAARAVARRLARLREDRHLAGFMRTASEAHGAAGPSFQATGRAPA